eukprot:3085886-Rhodomonas_salina.1
MRVTPDAKSHIVSRGKLHACTLTLLLDAHPTAAFTAAFRGGVSSEPQLMTACAERGWRRAWRARLLSAPSAPTRLQASRDSSP